MQRKKLFIFLSFLMLNVSAQNNFWENDLSLLENSLLEKDYLFKKISKIRFKYKIKKLKSSNLTERQLYWQLHQLLQEFDISNLEVRRKSLQKFPFEIKRFKNKYYLTKIHSNFSTFLGYELLKINTFPMDNISSSTLNIPSFLKHSNFSKSDTLQLHLLSEKKHEITINIPLSDVSLDDLVKVTPKQVPFYLQKPNRWFWMYGINYGQQVYFKYNIGLSKEFLQATMNRLQVSQLTMAKEYNLPLQTIYDAPTFTDFTEKLLQKLDKKRYKKLFIDIRGHKTGNSQAFTPFIKKLSELRRINKKNRLYILIDKNLSSSAIELVVKLKKELHITIIGESVTGTPCSSSQVKKLLLPNSKLTIYYPATYFEKISIHPDIEVSTSFMQYKNGVDPILQKAME